MERLTKRNEADTAYYYPNCFKECSGLGYSSKCDKCSFQDKVCEKLGRYEDLEEQGLLPPCTIGNDIYFIQSKVNFELNKLNKNEDSNRVYHQKVVKIVVTERGWYLECDKDLEYGTGHILVDKFYKETWFLTQAEAEDALKRMEREGGNG